MRTFLLIALSAPVGHARRVQSTLEQPGKVAKRSLASTLLATPLSWTGTIPSKYLHARSMPSRPSSASAARSRLQAKMVATPPKVGEVYRDCKIKQIKDYGAFVEVTPGHNELLHISQFTDDRSISVEEAGFKIGDSVDVKVERQDSKGNFRLSRLGGAANALPEVGKIYRDCKITEIKDYGAFVEVTPGHNELLHKSRITDDQSISVEEAGFNIGDSVDVKVERQDGKGNFLLSRAPEVGKIYRDCKITSIADFGVFVEVFPEQQALLHKSQITGDQSISVEDAGLKIGDSVDVKVERQDSKGNFRLSRLGGAANALPEVGKIYRDCKITEIKDYGAFVEVTPGHNELLHKSRITDDQSISVEEAGFNIGDSVDVIVVSRDERGRFRLRLSDDIGPFRLKVGKTYRGCKIIDIHVSGVSVEVPPGHQVLLRKSRGNGDSSLSIEETGYRVGGFVDVIVERRDEHGSFQQVDYGVLAEVTPRDEALLQKSGITGERPLPLWEAGFKVGDSVDIKFAKAS